jgi:hypothetical protein
MKLGEANLVKQAEEAVRACLAGIPFLEIQEIAPKEARRGSQPDITAWLTSTSGPRVLLIEVKNNGEPRFARQAVNQILSYREAFPKSYGVFVAPYVSPQAAQILKEQGIGYLDLSGNCRLCFEGVYVEREGKPNKYGTKRDLRTLFSPKATRILRVVLAKPKKAWRVTELAQEAGVSLGQVSNVKKLLEDREWVRRVKAGIFLAKPEELLAEWAENYTYRDNQIRDYYSMKPVLEIEPALAAACGRCGVTYALTGFSGAARYAPAVRFQRVMVYVDKLTEEIEKEVGLKEVTSGANVSLLIPYDEGVYYASEEFEGIRVVSPIQLYLDLRGYRGRGEEAAETLLERIIRPSW